MPTLTCDRCNGTGEYHGTRRDGSTYVGACFACQPNTGARFAGRRYFPRPSRYTPPAPATSAPAADAPRQRTAWTPREQVSVDAFAAAFPAEYAWLAGNESSNTFAASLLRGIARYGNLTPRQLAAVQRNLPTVAHAAPGSVPAVLVPINPDANGYHTDSLAAAAAALADDYFTERAAGASHPGELLDAPTPGFTAAAVDAAAAHVATLDRLAAMAPRPAVPSPGMTAEQIVTARPVAPPVTIAAATMRDALLHARNSGLRKPRLTLGLYEFRLGRTGTNRADTIYIYTRESIRTTRFAYAGAIAPDDRFFPAAGYGRVVLTLDQMELIRDAAANPRNAAAAHGHETTHCSCCRRLLTDPPSVMAGIGPVCITRFGWL